MFKSIHAENLFSWENLDYEIMPEISQICGWNVDDATSEGSGKSSVFNVLCWTLYGSIPKDAKIDEVVREGCKGGLGSVVLETNYKVYRSRKPNDLYIEGPDGKIIKGKDARETQGLINELIGRDFEAFCQTIYFAQNYPNKFISANEADKARILSEVQDLTIFDRARKKALDAGKAVDSELLDFDRQMTAVEAEISKLKSNATLITQYIKSFEEDKEAKIKTLGTKIEDAEIRIQDLKYDLASSDFESAETDIQAIEELLQALSAQKAELLATVKTIEVQKAEKARLEHNVESFEGKFQRNQKHIEKINSRIALTEAATSKLVSKVQGLEKDNSSPGNCPACGQKASESMLKDHRKHIQDQILEAVADIEAAGEAIEQAKAEIESLNEELENLKKEEAAAKKELKKAKEVPSVDETKAKLKQLDVEVQEFIDTKRRIQAGVAERALKKAELKNSEALLAQLETELDLTQRSERIKDYQKLEMIDSELLTQDVKRKTLQVQHGKASTKRQNLEILKRGFREVKQYVFQTLLKELSAKSTALASELFEVPIRVEFNNEDVEDGGVSKIRTTVTLNGKERSIGLLSGGQYSRVALAVNIALADIADKRGDKDANLMILDEPFQNLSLSSMEKMVGLLERRGKRVVLIEHNDLIKQIVNNVFEIELRDGVSRAV